LGGATLALSAMVREGCVRFAIADAWQVVAVLALAGVTMLASGFALKRGMAG
jgi:hypothetical protein